MSMMTRDAEKARRELHFALKMLVDAHTSEEFKAVKARLDVARTRIFEIDSNLRTKTEAQKRKIEAEFAAKNKFRVHVQV